MPEKMCFPIHQKSENGVLWIAKKSEIRFGKSELSCTFTRLFNTMLSLNEIILHDFTSGHARWRHTHAVPQGTTCGASHVAFCLLHFQVKCNNQFSPVHTWLEPAQRIPAVRRRGPWPSQETCTFSATDPPTGPPLPASHTALIKSPESPV